VRQQSTRLSPHILFSPQPSLGPEGRKGGREGGEEGLQTGFEVLALVEPKKGVGTVWLGVTHGRR